MKRKIGSNVSDVYLTWELTRSNLDARESSISLAKQRFSEARRRRSSDQRNVEMSNESRETSAVDNSRVVEAAAIAYVWRARC